ncbi:WD40 repeat domain-containing protein [Methylobacterium sp. WCS2018Hpa-22]|uniref:WD40 repeat domain-containing protein n=1 Tax=Methylobacterium sp. WCS2018Hpa-22 TaxID=3073633 RepID=UPI00288B6FFA|nr:WD40 repeat domain-containing protein [Methylobacterium sp. WCS2018Hpa-22]
MSVSAPTLFDHVVPLEAGAHVTGAVWLKDVLALALGDGAVLLVGPETTRRVEAHPEAGILVASGDGRRIVTGGDDGRIVATAADGDMTQVAVAKGGAWIDALALHPDGAIAYAAGRNVVARDAKGREKIFAAPSTARGLAFAPKGYRLAVAHYNGATLWYPNLETTPDFVEWKGSHIDVTWSPDGRFVVTTMQENSLHGWRLQPDRGHMRMSGYPGKVRSVSWSGDGNWLATSGAEAAIIWPFDSKEGPTGKAPRECGIRPARVTRVAFHPKALVLAIGYEDGCVMLVRFADASELLVRPATKGGAISALVWDGRGGRLAFGCADGMAGILTLPG